MELTVQRTERSELSTQGELSIDSRFVGFTLEPPHRDGDVKPRAIPAGRYRVTWRFSESHQRFVPHVEDVPGFDGIEIHPGNSPKDTKGCLLVGFAKSKDYVSASREACDVVNELVEDCNSRGEAMWITYLDPVATLPQEPAQKEQAA